MPVLATYAFTKGVVHKDSPVLKPIADAYHSMLQGALQRPKLIVSGAALAFVLTLATVPYLGTEFVPELEEGTIAVRVTLAPSSSLEFAKDVGEKLERVLIESFPEIIYVSARTGRAEIGGDPEPVSNIELFVGLKPVAQWSSAKDRKALQALMRERMAVVPRHYEATGLDVNPQIMQKLRPFARRPEVEEVLGALELIYREEIEHVRKGDYWFRYCCAERGLEPADTFRRILDAHGLRKTTRSVLNVPARQAAGFSCSELRALGAESCED